MSSTATKAPFPSLLIRATELIPQGAFAEAQAAFLAPEQELIVQLNGALTAGNVGVVAHFYMDPELQGVLSSCSWPHIKISDSLLMADHAIAMAEAGVHRIIVLGVDFMSENVRAMLDASGFENVQVYRVARDEIGCSLAESAEARAYGLYLHEAAQQASSLHVIYINTSLEVKAKAHARVPTLTCTSSNVVQTVLQAFAQVPDLHVWFGPDTYMGQNLEELFAAMEPMTDEEIRAVHPAHDRESVASLRKRFHIFNQGNCVVHQMFGASVVEKVEAEYPLASVAAHLEVPGEMFRLGMERQRDDRGCVGSTSNILSFIGRKVDDALAADEPSTVQVVLGTEAGMITSIVRDVQNRLRADGNVSGNDVGVEIVFPVASEAIATTDDEQLPVVPGVAAGEGCSTAGGCATCPYMKMNSLDALMGLSAGLADTSIEDLEAFEPRKYEERIAGRSVAELGGVPILHMRAFQASGELPDELVAHIQSGELPSA